MNSETPVNKILILAANPQGVSARHFLKDYQGAIKDYTQAIKIDHKNFTAYIKRGDAQYYLKKY